MPTCAVFPVWNKPVIYDMDSGFGITDYKVRFTQTTVSIYNF